MGRGQAAQHVVGGGAGDGGDGVDRGGALRGAAAEVQMPAAIADGELQTDGDRLVADAIVVEGILKRVYTGGDFSDGRARHPLAVVQQSLRRAG